MEFEELMLEMLKYPIMILFLSTVFRIVKAVMREAYIEKREEELTKKEEPQRINIDNDLKKYFNYKE